MQLTIPDFSLVLMMGATGSGKSTFAERNFLATEIISADRCRGMAADDESDQAATGDAFEILYFIAAKRLAARRLTVIDATNLRAEAGWWSPMPGLKAEMHGRGSGEVRTKRAGPFGVSTIHFGLESA